MDGRQNAIQRAVTIAKIQTQTEDVNIITPKFMTINKNKKKPNDQQHTLQFSQSHTKISPWATVSSVLANAEHRVRAMGPLV